MSKTGFQFREAQPSDAPALSQLAQQTYTDAFGHSMSAPDLARYLASRLSQASVRQMLKNHTFIVASHGSSLIGFVQLGEVRLEHAQFDVPMTLEPTDGQIERVYVLAAFQNRGVGSKLLERALEHPQLSGKRRIFIDVWDDNRGAKRLYERYGFTRVGQLPFVGASGEVEGYDELLMKVQA